MLDKIRGFCPEFYEKMFDFCLLTASRYGIMNRNIVFQPRHAHARTYPKIDQFCVELRQQLMSQHKEFLTNKIIGLQEQGCADTSPTGPPNAGRYIGTEVNERSIEPQKTDSAQSPSKLVDSEFLMCSLGMFKQNLPSRDESPSWKSGSLCVAKNLDVWYIINKMDNLIESTPMCMGCLIINEEDFRKTCEIWRLDTPDSDGRPLVMKGKIERCGLVKKRGQVNTSYKDRFLVLNHDVLEYYEDVASYIQGNTGTNLVSKAKGSLFARCLQVSPGAQDGVNKSSDGYHFTLTYQESGFSPKIIEFACMDEEGRDKWVQKIREANAAVCIHSHLSTRATNALDSLRTIGRFPRVAVSYFLSP
jgi:hypothetical protein